MVIAGYPLVGKSSLSKRLPRYIDLESSHFSQNNIENWEKLYAEIAVSLSTRTNDVFVSTHDKVIDALRYYTSDLLLIYPDENLYNVWVDKAEDRYEMSSSMKNLRALKRVRDFFHTDIAALKVISDCNHLVIDDINYDLEDMLYKYNSKG